MAEVLQVEFSGVLCQIDGVYILESKQRKQMCLTYIKHLLALDEKQAITMEQMKGIQ